jgi:hypothetical protein
MNRARLGTFLAIIAGALVLPLLSVAQNKEPLVGTWILDVGKSTFAGAPGPKGQMRTYAFAGGEEKMTSRGISREGQPTFVHYQAQYDGKDYDMIGSLGGNKISLKRIDRLTSEITQKRDGKPAIVATRQVSQDEKTLTVVTKGTLPDGRMLDSVMVFHRN